MRGKIMSSLFLAGVVIACSGCGTLLTNGSSSGTRRTVSTAPTRNTEAAKRANDVGFKHLANGELTEATEAFRRALSADAEFGPAHNNLGKVYFKQKDYYRAAWKFEYASKLLPTHPEPRNNLGLVLEEAGELDRAVECYREAVMLDADSVEYLANLTRALIRRGDRTSEVRTLLRELLERDIRPEWHTWAKLQAAHMGIGLE